MPTGELITTEAEVPPEAAQLLDLPDEEALRLEGELIQATDNGWHEGDPENQPDNTEAPEEG